MKYYKIVILIISIAVTATIICSYTGLISMSSSIFVLSFFSLALIGISGLLLHIKIKLNTNNQAGSMEKNQITSSSLPKDEVKTRSSLSISYTKTDTNTKNNIIKNHQQFNDMLNKAISMSQRKSQIMALMIIDINESNMKHDVSSDVISIISGVLRNEDIIAHLNDEVIILLSDIGKPKFASIVAEKIISKFKMADNKSQNIYIGISTFPEDGCTIESLIDHASDAACRAKNNNHDNNYEFYANRMNIEAKEYSKLKSSLSDAIKDKNLTLYYQPKLEVKTARITGVEALMRWNHPTLGQINPQQFISIAEETGSHMQIAETALNEACIMNKSWQKDGLEHITVSVNISPKQFTDSDLPKLVKNALTSADLHPSYLELEVSEQIIMSNIDIAKERLETLKKIGVKISIDHFGTGYTAISFLKKFPLNTIKIDRSYIKGTPNNPDDIAITNAFISLAHNLGLSVVADGVETAEQVQYLTKQGCDFIQGYFLCHPVPSGKISSQLKKLSSEVDIN